MRLFTGVLLAFLLFSCTQETQWISTDYYSDGSKKVEKQYVVEKGDTLFLYQKNYYEDGKLQLEGPLQNGKRSGKWVSYYPEGGIWSETHFEDGMSQGESKSYYENGKLRYEGNYEKGIKSGKWMLYDTTGTLVKSADLDNK